MVKVFPGVRYLKTSQPSCTGTKLVCRVPAGADGGDPLSSRHQRHGMEDEKMLFGVHFRDSPPENVEITFK